MDQATLTFPQMLSEKQAARMLSVSVAALRRWRRERRGPQFARIERCVRYDLRAIEVFLAENSSCSKRAAEPRGEAERHEHATEPR
jgi:hypothetical protein